MWATNYLKIILLHNFFLFWIDFISIAIKLKQFFVNVIYWEKIVKLVINKAKSQNGLACSKRFWDVLRQKDIEQYVSVKKRKKGCFTNINVKFGVQMFFSSFCSDNPN